ncbi:MAG: tyrosine--tRNA ligase [Candidatus Mycalebacterium zealandia]|nr:MAG: tyrosine--tRNA ligase [Candidatus Mycalebacterium zealandia]
MKDPKQQLEIIKKGADGLVSDSELLEKLKKGKPLRVKAGFDPTAPDLHLGHCVLLRKLRDFQDLGHTVVFLIGDFTAQIGDPSGRTDERPLLSPADIKKNAKTYEGQVFPILDKKRTEVRFNSQWHAKMNSAELLRLAGMANVANLLERDDFKTRYKSGAPISVKEFLYPLIQAYDSVALKADVEIGGTDQTFNLLLGREVQKRSGQPQQATLFLPILEGLDGVNKMSKSLGNYIAVKDTPEDVFAKVMSVSDKLMWRYYELLSAKTPAEIKKLKKSHPMDAKRALAFEITAWLNNEKKAEKAQNAFSGKFSKREFPSDAKKKTVQKAKVKTVLNFVSEVSTSLKSRAEAKRLIAQGGLTINGEKYTDIAAKLPKGNDFEVKIGKKEFVRVRVG